MLRTPHFYMLFAMALMMGIGGLMVTAQVAPMANTFKIARGGRCSFRADAESSRERSGRLFWGWVSDHLGRERTMSSRFCCSRCSC